MAVTVLVFC